MNRQIKIATSILTAQFNNLEQSIKELEKAGSNYIHLDIMDGVFVPPITFGSKIAEDIKKMTHLPLDTHLMTVHPENHIESFAKAGSSIISIHLEGNIHIHRTLSLIKSFNVKAGIVLNPHTSEENIKPLLDIINHVLIMSVNPGYGGQSFIKSSLKKIENTRNMIDVSKRNISLAVDGGVSEKNVLEIIKAGADFLIAGSAIIDSKNKNETIKKLRGL